MDKKKVNEQKEGINSKRKKSSANDRMVVRNK